MTAPTVQSDRHMYTAAKLRQPVTVERPSRTTITGRLVRWRGERRPTTCTIQLASGAYITAPTSAVQLIP